MISTSRQANTNVISTQYDRTRSHANQSGRIGGAARSSTPVVASMYATPWSRTSAIDAMYVIRCHPVADRHHAPCFPPRFRQAYAATETVTRAAETVMPTSPRSARRSAEPTVSLPRP